MHLVTPTLPQTSTPLVVAAERRDDFPFRLDAKFVAVIAGPCSVESRSQIDEAADAVREAGAVALRAGAFKPRTDPRSFQGHGARGLEWLRAAADQYGLKVVTEVLDQREVALVAELADVLQMGTRNMQNYRLLVEAGQSGKTVLLKRGFRATLAEFLFAADYVLQTGNRRVILCERGIRTFEDHTRNTLSLASVPDLHLKSPLPVIVDPSHGTGRADLVVPMARAAVAAGADGLLIEVHPNPAAALTDGAQSLDPPQFRRLMDECRRVATAVGRTM